MKNYHGNILQYSLRIISVLNILIILSAYTNASEKNVVEVPMRDGVLLSTDLYFPESSNGPWPLIVIRTPNYKERYYKYGEYFSFHGYAVAIQDVRGQNKSEGRFRIWMHDKEDGYDAIEWLAEQDWCDGKVGMTGGSYNGWAQLAAATTKPPHLLTIAAIVTTGDPSIHHVYPFGVYALTQQLNVISIFHTKFGTGGDRYKLARGFQNNLMSLPVIDLDKKLFGMECPWWREHIKHKPFDPYWEKADVLHELESINIPVFIIGGWFDFGGIGTKVAYKHLTQSKAMDVKLLIGPWMHQTIGKSQSLGYDFGPLAAADYMQELLDWFDYHLKGVENGVVEEPLVKIFAVDSNIWLEGDTYPLRESEELKLFFHTSGNLEFSPPSDDSFSTYTYDPSDPTPSLWYDNLPDHNTIKDTRKDMLFFKATTFEKDIQVVGPISATLYASTSAEDTDWFVYYMLLDEHDELQSLGRGLIRARYQDGRQDNLLKPEEIYRFDLDLWHSSFRIKKGFRFEVIVCSSAFPHYSRNLNTGGDNEVDSIYQPAKQKIFHSREYPSSISITTVSAF